MEYSLSTKFGYWYFFQVPKIALCKEPGVFVSNLQFFIPIESRFWPQVSTWGPGLWR